MVSVSLVNLTDAVVRRTTADRTSSKERSAEDAYAGLMAQVCGRHPGPVVARRRPRGLSVGPAFALGAAVAVLALTAGAARADSSPPRPPPQPQNLWHAYPLDAGSPSPSPSRAIRTAARSPSNDSRPPLLLWVAIAGFGAAALAFVVSRRSGRPWRFVNRLADHRLVVAADGAALDVEPVPAVDPPAAPKVLKVPKAPKAPPSERAMLKRKETGGTASEAKTLKEKERRMRPSRTADDVSVLRAKLAGRSPRPASNPAPVGAPARLRPVSATRCHIGWWRGYVKSEFQAYSASPGRQPAVVATSPPFRWSKSEPPPADLAEAVSAHAVLREELEATEWVATGKREHWYAIEFERRPNVARRGRAEHEH